MKKTQRRTRFEGRVDLERNFLTRVNAIFGHSLPLAGMTESAIQSWARRASVNLPLADIERIKKILIEASTRAELLADNSRDVFEPERRPRLESLKHLEGVLEEALGILSHV
jgi:hypothetical protein